MHYAIIAAGEGSRLREEGVLQPKPLVPIQGIPMIDRLLDIMRRCGAESISVICNAAMTDVQEHLRHYIELHSEDIPMRLLVESTPSSMHSLARLSEIIPTGKVCVTTVDTIFRESEFAAYIQAFERAEEGLFAVTSFVDDEKPLWVACPQADDTLPIVGFFDREPDIPAQCHHMVSGGIYGLLTASAWPVLHRCLAEGQSRMRNYQRALVNAGITLHAYPFEQIMDIDHASDIAKAEAWLSSSNESGHVLAICRAEEYSPNNVVKDEAILQEVVERLKCQNFSVDVMSEDELSLLSATALRSYSHVVHMARRFKTLSRLQQLDAKIVNPPQAVITTAGSRELTFSLLHEAGISVPPFWAYDPEEDEMFQCEPDLQQLLPGWIKVMRPQGVQPNDVNWVETPLQVDANVIRLAAEQVPDIVVMKHVEGDLLKVYVVADNRKVYFLRAFYPQEQGYSKFGEAEKHNSVLKYIEFKQDDLQTLAQAIAQTLHLQVFGFDAIVRQDGSLCVIDVNDWPSFSSCRVEAADAICLLSIGNRSL